MKIYLFLLSLFFMNCTFSEKQEINENAKQEFRKHLDFIKSTFEKEEIDSHILLNSITILEETSKINCYEVVSEIGNYKVPLIYDYNDWKDWYELNKDKLRLDEKTKEIVIENPIALKKNAAELFDVYLSDMEDMVNNKNYEIEKLGYLINKLESLTKYDKIDFSFDCNCRLPNDEDIKFFKQWKKKNNLKWDFENQRIVVLNN